MAKTNSRQRLPLARYARDDLVRILPEELRGLEYLYARNQNPLAAWRALQLCDEYDLPLPLWARRYFRSAADDILRIDSRPKTGNKGRQVLRTLGFVAPDASPITKFRNEVAELERFLAIENAETKRARSELVKRYAAKHRVEEQTINNQNTRWRHLLRGKQRISAL